MKYSNFVTFKLLRVYISNKAVCTSGLDSQWDSYSYYLHSILGIRINRYWLKRLSLFGGKWKSQISQIDIGINDCIHKDHKKSNRFGHGDFVLSISGLFKKFHVHKIYLTGFCTIFLYILVHYVPTRELCTVGVAYYILWEIEISR